MRRRRAEDGMASVWVIAATLVVVVLAVAGLSLAQTVAARNRAATAADLGALAAAAAAVRQEPDPCGRATDLVRLNGADFQRCEVDGVDVRVWVSKRLPGPLSAFGPARARARAGPVDRREATGDRPAR